jgi:hypothetical protein
MEWVPIEKIPQQGDYVIKTLHSDSLEDVMRIIDGKLYSFDARTKEKVTHFQIDKVLRESLPEQPQEDQNEIWKEVLYEVNEPVSIDFLLTHLSKLFHITRKTYKQ